MRQGRRKRKWRGKKEKKFSWSELRKAAKSAVKGIERPKGQRSESMIHPHRHEFLPTRTLNLIAEHEVARLRKLYLSEAAVAPAAVTRARREVEKKPEKPVGKRLLNTIALEILQDWKKPYFGAVPYIEAMLQMGSIDDMYGMDTGTSVVAYFLANAGTWKGEKAKEIKKELKTMLKKRGWR